MCGIFCFLGDGDAFEIILNALNILKNRGYDSSGIATISSNDTLVVSKYASKDTCDALCILKAENLKHRRSSVGIGHNRWRTHGGKTDINSHPHNDNDNLISVVHNGIIDNYMEIKEFLSGKGYKFISETDTEVIANLVNYYLKKSKDINKAIESALEMLNGTWALGILYRKNKNSLYVCRNGSPLLVAYGDRDIYVSSESSAFPSNISDYIVVEDKEFMEINLNNSRKMLIKGNRGYDLTDKRIKRYNNETNSVFSGLKNHDHWMIKEITEQPESINRAINNGGRIINGINLGGIEKNGVKLLSIKNLVLLGSGTSFHACLLAEKVFKQFDCFNTVTVIDSAEFTIFDIPKDSPGFIVVSQSGETKDLHIAMNLVRQYDINISIVSVVNVVGSLIARDSDFGVYTNCGKEVAVASTKSFTSQVVCLILIALWISQKKNTHLESRQSIINDLRYFAEDSELNIKAVRNYDCSCFTDTKNIIIIGRNYTLPIALEGALKIKEVTYINTSGISSGGLKHGTIALIDRNVTTIALMIEENKAMIMNSIEEIKSRDGKVILITSDTSETSDMFQDIIKIKTRCKSEIVKSLILNMVMQIIAYNTAIKLENNPDFPRNLAKVVTVV